MCSVYIILDKILDILETADVIKNGSMEKNIVGNIKFENMYFRYVEKSRYVLEGIDLNISVGKIVGIVGENGVGKTTQFLWSQIGIMPQ